MTMMTREGPEPAHRLLDFVNASPTPFHAVAAASALLEKAGFTKIHEQDDWEKDVKPSGKYYFTRNQSAILAFTIPKGWQPGAGLSIVATHIDSPNLRIRPVSKRSKLGYMQVGVETYGGGTWHTWFDRDLGVAGRVVVADKSGNFHTKLVKIDKPIMRIPNLAIHLERGSADNFKFNMESEFVPILALEHQLNAKGEDTRSSQTSPSASSIQANHHPALLKLLATELSVAPETIHDFELHLFDVNKSVLGGLNSEFVFSPRLDNQFSSYCAVEAIANFASSSHFAALEGNVACISLFNHEEIGSVSTTGAESSLVPFLLQRLSPAPGAYAQSVARSFLISADMGHAVHPNYASKHEDNHAPRMNGGVIIKTNAKQRYASDSVGSFLVKKLIEKRNGKVQEYEVRNDMACGSTVGPFLSKIGVRTVDIGCAMLAMHSIRETAGSYDVQNYIDLFEEFFAGFSTLDKSLSFE
ncbi:aspartyl aminopeptidase [Epithele typhae]|uniref:aspartyl aminopeptidase n=1 Tax=Epithele typhae TaxID=378194 RepID=UPI0020082965|nr:aspartyl aminopeptidase [Epithele typhae]KAH9943345.1 aspartyl aminopeptidase [Epithele typhae]